ncbi:MAG: hypothetical protein WCS73_06225 [Lentisphaeria bacterium]
MTRIICKIFLVFLVCLFLAGCVVERGSNPESTLPGNKPASWEGHSMGVPI